MEERRKKIGLQVRNKNVHERAVASRLDAGERKPNMGKRGACDVGMRKNIWSEKVSRVNIKMNKQHEDLIYWFRWYIFHCEM